MVAVVHISNANDDDTNSTSRGTDVRHLRRKFRHKTTKGTSAAREIRKRCDMFSSENAYFNDLSRGAGG